jgi:membrane-associated phospholipid phosphatase
MVGLLVTGIKFVTGRVRPKFAASPEEFRPFSGASSFPSGHTGAAFALAGSLALEALPPVGVAMLVGATGTGWSRMNDNKHWLSDVVSGALLALLIAALVRRWDAYRVAQRGTGASRGPPATSV